MTPPRAVARGPAGVVLDARGGAFFPEEKLLVVADLHVGFEATARARGAGLPRVELDVLLPLLDGMLRDHAPETIVLDGDVQHAFGRNLPDEARGVRAVVDAIAARARVVLVTGNHDRALSRVVGTRLVVASHRAGRLLFMHGHEASARAQPEDVLVVGHEHPAIDLALDVRTRVRLRAFLHAPATLDAPETLVLPALAPWAAGYDALRRGPFLGAALAGRARDDFTAWGLGEGEVLEFGNVGDLRRLRRQMKPPSARSRKSA